MLTHRGKILREVVDKYCAAQGSTISAVAQKAGYNQATIYRHFEKEDLPFHIIRKYGKAMGHDFRMEYPEMEEEMAAWSEPTEKYGNYTQTLSEVVLERDQWREKYYRLLEIHNKLLMERLQNQGL
ncbi:TetR/AcrR family transcriptional regulator [Mariniradius saccharolyticus]|uniref:TetR/AcrR family transcriptional regulator n=1 Tax=Mariniradius saccharolyticus TaxID=1245591 RepID=UPI0002E5686B|nr:TetR family transcriptional regulator [Mariniradius saccharolyticus]